MRLFIDSRDLINMFNSETPIPIGDLADKLRKHNHQLVLPFSLISELVPANNSNIVVLRRFTKLEEDFSLSFFQQKDLPKHEIRTATDDFVAGRQFSAFDPYVGSFHELWGERFRDDPIFLMDVDRTIGMRRMSTQIELTLERAEIFHWREAEAAQAVAILRNEQNAIVKDDPKTVFRSTVARWLKRSAATDLSAKDEQAFADALRKSPRVAPGWRLFCEVFDQMAKDKGYTPTVNDVWDLAHITILPYVDAMTLDKNKVEAVRKAAQRLRVFDPSIDYEKRAFVKVGDLLSATAP